MESLLGVASETSWSSFDAIMSVEESEIMAQLLGPYPFSSENDHGQCLGSSSSFWSEYINGDTYYSRGVVDPTLYYCSQENSCNATSFIAPHPDYENYYQSESSFAPAVDASSMQMNFCMAQEHISNPSSLQVVPSAVPADQTCMLEEETSGNNSGDSSTSIQELAVAYCRSQPKRTLQVLEEDDKAPALNKDDIPTESSKKKARSSSNVRCVKNGRSKKAQKSNKPIDEDESNAALVGQSSSCYSSEDDSHTSQELNGGKGTSSSSKGSTALTSSEKSRAGRGSATDPQSLYARKRRERINERLRILQNLVPNGTKVDISTMLEEAVQYVKFLQLQIKLLSSDDLWMYAPLAYNGMDIGLDLNISPPKQ